MRILPRPEEGLRAVIGQAMDQAKDQAPRAEAAAARWVERTRPAWSWLAREWRRLGTVAAVILIVGLLLHAMFGANGMVVYRQKRAEMQSLADRGRAPAEGKQPVRRSDQIAQVRSCRHRERSPRAAALHPPRRNCVRCSRSSARSRPPAAPRTAGNADEHRRAVVLIAVEPAGREYSSLRFVAAQPRRLL